MRVRLAIAALLTVSLVGAGAVLSARLLDSSDAPTDRGVLATLKSAPEPAAAAQSDRVGVLELKGTVEYRHAGGKWRTLEPGTPLDIRGEVRTGSGSMARLRLGSAVTVELADSTAINIAQLSETLSRIRLQDGRVVSEVDAERGVRLRVQVQGTDAEAETGSGRFAVMRRGNTPAVFASERGNLEVAAAGKTVDVRPGEQTVVSPGRAPSQPTRIPPSLLLKLGTPPPSRMRERKVLIAGMTAPGAAVRAGGSVATADSEGRFSNAVSLVDGPNEIVVEVEDVLGRRTRGALPRIVVDSSAPRVRGKVVW